MSNVPERRWTTLDRSAGGVPAAQKRAVNPPPTLPFSLKCQLCAGDALPHPPTTSMAYAAGERKKRPIRTLSLSGVRAGRCRVAYQPVNNLEQRSARRAAEPCYVSAIVSNADLATYVSRIEPEEEEEDEYRQRAKVSQAYYDEKQQGAQLSAIVQQY
jgi:hypothetical protein